MTTLSEIENALKKNLLLAFEYTAKYHKGKYIVQPQYLTRGAISGSRILKAIIKKATREGIRSARTSGRKERMIPSFLISRMMGVRAMTWRFYWDEFVKGLDPKEDITLVTKWVAVRALPLLT